MTTSSRTRTPALDAQCAAAVDLARSAAEDVGEPTAVGEHLRVVAEGDRLVTHVFACGLAGYRGWEWSVTVARASRSREVTVSETVLLPGGDALVAPAWLPYAERIRPGDLSVGEILPSADDDPRLDPGYTAGASEDDAEPDLDPVGLVAYELGLGRARVLSPWGRDDAAARWYDGEHGPGAAIAQAAPAHCSTCGYLVALGGPLRAVFGVCANEWSPADGRVVSYDHGCGAHSEVAVAASERDLDDEVLDTDAVDVLVLDPTAGDEAADEVPETVEAEVVEAELDGATEVDEPDVVEADVVEADVTETSEAETDGTEMDGAEMDVDGAETTVAEADVEADVEAGPAGRD